MGWLTPADAASSPKATPTPDGGYIAPDRGARAACWEARDAFFACLDRANIIDSIKAAPKAQEQCPKELVEFEKQCVDSWVTYFKKRRVMEYQRDMTLKRLEGERAKVAEAK